MNKGSFNSPSLLLWLLSNSRIVSPFWEKEILAWYFSKKLEEHKWVRAEELMSITNGAEDLMRTELVSPRGSKQKGTGEETGPSCGSLEIPTIWAVLGLKGTGWVIVVRLGPGSVVQCQLELENSSPCGEMFPKLIKREDWKQSVWFLWVPSLRPGRRLERLVRGLKTPKVLKFATVSFPMSRLFAIIA